MYLRIAVSFSSSALINGVRGVRNVSSHVDAGLDTQWPRVCTQVETNTTAVCQVRQHMFVWSKEHPRLMNVKSGPRLAMHRHGQYKYLVHLDGQALSSRMDLLLPLNSLIFKEESGYKSFYHHLLKPMVRIRGSSWALE